MSVTVDIVVVKEWEEWNPPWGDHGPRPEGEQCNFGDTLYIHMTHALYKLEGQVLTIELIDRLLAWPRIGGISENGVWTFRDQQKLSDFLRAHKRWYLDFWVV